MAKKELEQLDQVRGRELILKEWYKSGSSKKAQLIKNVLNVLAWFDVCIIITINVNDPYRFVKQYKNEFLGIEQSYL